MENERLVPFESKDNVERLRSEIQAAAQEMGAELSEEELRVAAEGSRTEEEMWVPFKLSERAAGLSLLAREGVSPLSEDPTVRIDPESKKDNETRRKAGAQSSLIKAACYLKAMPELADECLQYAWDVWYKKRVWDADDVPQMTVPTAKPAEGEEDKLRRAA